MKCAYRLYEEDKEHNITIECETIDDIEEAKAWVKEGFYMGKNRCYHEIEIESEA